MSESRRSKGVKEKALAVFSLTDEELIHLSTTPMTESSEIRELFKKKEQTSNGAPYVVGDVLVAFAQKYHKHTKMEPTRSQWQLEQDRNKTAHQRMGSGMKKAVVTYEYHDLIYYIFDRHTGELIKDGFVSLCDKTGKKWSQQYDVLPDKNDFVMVTKGCKSSRIIRIDANGRERVNPYAKSALWNEHRINRFLSLTGDDKATAIYVQVTEFGKYKSGRKYNKTLAIVKRNI